MPYIEISNNNVIFRFSDESAFMQIDVPRGKLAKTLKNCPYTISCISKRPLCLQFDSYDFTGVKLKDIFKTLIDLNVDGTSLSEGINKNTFTETECNAFGYSTTLRSPRKEIIDNFNILPQNCKTLDIENCIITDSVPIAIII